MQQRKKSTALVWFRNDLRVHDNDVLQQACETHENVIGVYCFSDLLYNGTQFGFRKIGKFRARFILQSVARLKQQLEALNIDLVVDKGVPETILPELCEKHQVNAIYLQKEWTSEEVEELQGVREMLPENISVHEIYNQFLFHPEDIPLGINEIPRVFTAFRKKLENEAEIRPEVFITKKPITNRIPFQSKIPTLQALGYKNFESHPHAAFPFEGGEHQALKRLENYFFETKRLGVYKKTRNGLIGPDYSSKFSPWLANGCISARTIYWKVKEFEKGFFANQSTYWLIFELIWRDFFKYISLKHGASIFCLQGILGRTYPWDVDPTKIENWIHGTTPEPFVNANMIELKETGWMSNRGRQNVASYFSKTLNLDWRIGAAYFESLLIDYDVHSNYGNWMYTAGVGNDPRDRVFNVALQAERYDAKGTYQRLWLQPVLF
ncbi:MAG: DASH family cryptochrome [Aureisphaera sp.]